MAVAQLVAGLLGAVLGVVLSQWWTSKREKDRDSRLADHDHETWVRDIRYKTHLEFLADLEGKFHTVAQHRDNEAGFDEPPDDYLVELYRRLNGIRLISTDATVDQAQQALSVLSNYCFYGGKWEAVEYATDHYLGAVRDELNLPAVKLMAE